MRALNVFLAFAVSFLLAFLVFEGGLRLFPAFRPLETVNEYHADLGWWKKPGAVADRSTSEFDITFEINSRGLRDDAISTVEKTENTFRILALGDSFVLGYTVDREDLFVDLMEGWWRSEQRRVEVINAGTEGYSTDQEVLWFQKYKDEFKPDLVLLFPYENDIYWNGQERYTRFPKPRYEANGSLEQRKLEDPGPGSLLNGWAIGNFLQKIVYRHLPQPSSPPHHFQPAHSEELINCEFAPLFHEPPPFLADCLARTKGALTALKKSCDDIGAQLVMVPIPSESAIQEDEKERLRDNPKALKGIAFELWSPDNPVERFLEMGAELGIETLDPRAKLKDNYPEGADPLYFHDEWHFNPRGNRVFAEFLVQELDELGVFPAGHEAITPGRFPEHEDEDGGPVWLYVFLALWAILGTTFRFTYRDEPIHLAFLKVGGLLAVVFAIILGGGWLLGRVPASYAPWIVLGFVVVVLGFVVWKLGRRMATILELLRAFTLRGHWYLMPLIVVLLTIGSLLVVAASSPLIAPFIYTLF